MNDTKLRLLSLFSGIGAFEKGLERIGVPYELAGFSEIDKYAIQSYCAIHNVDESLNLGDVSQISDEYLPQGIDMITYGFPCQDISVAGHQKGITNNTRSGLLFEAERIIEHTKPKFAIAENVKNLVSKKFKDDFNALLDRLDSYGYNNYWQVLNAKDYGVPQNRERVFIISVRKDIDSGMFQFPEKQKLTTSLKDMLVDDFEDKHIIKNDKADKLLKMILKTGHLADTECADGSIKNPQIKDVSNCITARYDSGIQNRASVGTVVIEPKLKRLGGWNDTKDRKRQSGEIYDTRGLCPTLNTMQGGGLQPHIVVKEGTKKGYTTTRLNRDSINVSFLGSTTRRGRVGKGVAQTLDTNCSQVVFQSQVCEERSDEGLRFFKDNVCGTIRTIDSGGDKRVIGKNNQAKYFIRKLTPLECWRLMGFDDDDYWKARARLEKVFYKGKDRSNSQMYKQAGNSIVVNVVEQIYKEMKKADLL